MLILPPTTMKTSFNKFKGGSWASVKKAKQDSANGHSDGPSDADGMFRSAGQSLDSTAPMPGLHRQTQHSKVQGKLLALIEALEESCGDVDVDTGNVALSLGTAQSAIGELQECVTQCGDIQAKLTQVRDAPAQCLTALHCPGGSFLERAAQRKRLGWRCIPHAVFQDGLESCKQSFLDIYLIAQRPQHASVVTEPQTEDRLATAEGLSQTLKPSAWANRERKYKQDLEQYEAAIAAQADLVASLQGEVAALAEGAATRCGGGFPCVGVGGLGVPKSALLHAPSC